MLELLMCNPRNLISTERFLEKIWGYDNEAEINVVWVYISYLRKKLAALHSNVQIKARRNVGYSLEEISSSGPSAPGWWRRPCSPCWWCSR